MTQPAANVYCTLIICATVLTAWFTHGAHF